MSRVKLTLISFGYTYSVFLTTWSVGMMAEATVHVWGGRVNGDTILAPTGVHN